MKERLKSFAKKIPGVATAYRQIRDYRLAHSAPKVTPFGFSMVGNHAMEKGTFEPEETKFFKTLIEDADVLVNAGANTGYYCLHALAAHKQVIAFEPMPQNAALLRKNIGINNWTERAEVFEMALGDRSGTVPMYGSGTGASLIKGWASFSPRKPIMIPLSSLDAILGNKLKGKKVMVLVDVEGAEYDLILGAKKLLASDPKPLWMVEVTLWESQPKGRATNPNFLKTFELFWSYDYDAYGLKPDGMVVPVRHEEIREMSISGKKDLQPNIIFIHRASHASKKRLLQGY